MTDDEFLEYLKSHPELWDIVMAVLLPKVDISKQVC